MNNTQDKPKPSGPVRRSFANGSTIFKEGDAANCAYIVESGHVEIFKVVNGRRIHLGSVGPWGMFGELGLIDSSPRMASAYASDDCVCMVVSQASVAELMDGAPQGLNTLIYSLVQIIRATGQDLAEARYQLAEHNRLA